MALYDPPNSPLSDTQRARLLAADHLSALAEAERLTDFPFTLSRIKQLRLKVRVYRDEGNAGMLGPNGYGPAIADVLASARFHGKAL